MVQQWNAETLKYDDKLVSGDRALPEDAKETRKNDLIFRRHLNAEDQKKIDSEEVEIHLQALKDLVSQIDQYWRDTPMDNQQPAILKSPFIPFVNAWEKYHGACEVQDGDTSETTAARAALRELLDIVKRSDALASFFRSRDTMLSSRKIKFEFLWTLFGHGTIVYARPFMNAWQMFEVRNCSSPPLKGRRFRVSCIGFDWDGFQFSTFGCDFYIKEFADEKSIHELDVFPTAFYTGQGGDRDDSPVRQELFERGKPYCALCVEDSTAMPLRCEYQGKAQVSPYALHRLRQGRVGEGFRDPDIRSRADRVRLPGHASHSVRYARQA